MHVIFDMKKSVIIVMTKVKLFNRDNWVKSPVAVFARKSTETGSLSCVMVCLIGMDVCACDLLHHVWLWLASVTISILGEQSTYNQARAEGCSNMGYPPETLFVRPQYPFQLYNRSVILQRARLCHFHALYKLLKRLGKCEINSYEQTRHLEIWA